MTSASKSPLRTAPAAASEVMTRPRLPVYCRAACGPTRVTTTPASVSPDTGPDTSLSSKPSSPSTATRLPDTLMPAIVARASRDADGTIRSQLAAGVSMNRLARERSPYLLQPAPNPVDWYGWGDEAFAGARAEDKPIFLSIGYSTCHWCHVMEHESFMSEAIADALNRSFVSIKVDREERPDVDRVYMAFVQATTGSGGWPMTVFLTPGLKPFYGGTYFPPASRWGRPGFLDLLGELERAWKEDQPRVNHAAGELFDRLQLV